MNIYRLIRENKGDSYGDRFIVQQLYGRKFLKWSDTKWKQVDWHFSEHAMRSLYERLVTSSHGEYGHITVLESTL